MPRDDLSIDFVKRMPQGGEALDPSLILEDWMNRVANLPEEIRFLQDEISERDRQLAECIRIIEERDGRIQKFIKANSSHENNPREEGYRKTIVENYNKAEALADEKITLSKKIQAIMDRHTRQLDMQIKQLYDRGEPGFTDPDELPSLLRPTAANQTAPAARSSSVQSSSALPAASVNGMLKEATKAAAASTSSAVAGAGNSASASSSGRGASNAQVRQAQAQQGHSASAPASPAATMILSRQVRESSAGPGTGPGKRGPRISSSLANAPPASSGLARHSSLGPGTPKSHQTATGVQRAGSAGPRATTKGIGAGPGRKASTPLASSGSVGGAAGLEKASGPGRKKGTGPANAPTTKTSLSRVKRPAKNSAASSTAESELSDADSGSDSNSSSRRVTPARGSSQGGSGSGSGAVGASGATNGNNTGNGDKERSSQPQIKREKDSSSGGSGGGGPGAPVGAGGHPGPGGGGGSGNGGSSGGGSAGGSGSSTTKHRPGDGPGGRGGVGKGAPSSDDRMDLDDEEAGDDRKYCLCQNVSFGDMVACDNEDCPFEWFHWSCVGLKSEPNGTWYCPVCTEKMKGGSGGGGAATGVHGTGHHASRGGGIGASNDSGNNGASTGAAATNGSGGGGSGTPAATKKGK